MFFENYRLGWRVDAVRARRLLPTDHASPGAMALHIDHWLWREGQNKGPDIKLYHRTRSVYY